MLQVDIRELARGPVDTVGELAATDPLFAGLDFVLSGPVRVRGRLQAAGEGRFYWHGHAAAAVHAQCCRCLVPVAAGVTADIGALFTSDADVSDDPDSYPLARDATLIDVTPAIREELILAAPRYAVCRDDCRGLCPRCGGDLNAGPCGCASEPDPRWQGLAPLKGKLPS